MAYDEQLAERLRGLLAAEPGITEKQMFGGLGFLADGNLAVSASGRGGLLVRVDPAVGDGLVDQPGVAAFEMRGRAMRGWLHVDEVAVTSDDELRSWVDRGVAFARTLPPK